MTVHGNGDSPAEKELKRLIEELDKKIEYHEGRVKHHTDYAIEYRRRRTEAMSKLVYARENP